MFKESLKMSWKNIVHNKMRSFLTVLGIVIGVAAIIALITIVQGVTNEVTSEFSAMGTNTLSVQIKGTALKSGLNEKELEQLKEIEGIEVIYPTVSLLVPVVREGEVQADISIQGKNEEFFRHESDLILSGRAINPLDVTSKNRVCIISESLQKKLFFAQNALDQTLQIGGITYTVVGIAEDSSSVEAMMNGTDCVYIPYRNALTMTGSHNVTSAELYMKDSSQADAIIQSVKNVLNQAFNYKDDSYSVTNLEDLLSMMNDITGMMTTMLVGIASIALLVGGIGIMNMMLVSVTERTTEIGLRKALGAEPRRIQLQFLLESIFLALFGGIIGLLAGILVAFLVSLSIGFPFGISLEAIFLAVGFSTLVGVVFGLVPARKASRLNPIDALRSV
ncbi:MAG: ABC transporter permease [Clostridium sp.]